MTAMALLVPCDQCGGLFPPGECSTLAIGGWRCQRCVQTNLEEEIAFRTSGAQRCHRCRERYHGPEITEFNDGRVLCENCITGEELDEWSNEEPE